MFATITSTGWLASLASAAGGTRAINRPIQFDYSVMAITSPDGRCPLVLLRAGTVGRRMKVGGVRTVGLSTVRVPGGTSCSSRLLRLPIRQSCERSCLSQSRGPGMSCAHRSMNAGQSAEKPFAPKRGETKIALDYHQQRRASVADETSTKRSCAFEGGSTSV
jgi:hypothetical protein